MNDVVAKPTSPILKIVGLLLFGAGIAYLCQQYINYKNATALPACNSSEIVQGLDDIVKDSPLIKLTGMRFTLSMHGEQRYRENPPRRVCRAQLETDERGTEALYYAIDWQQKEQGIYWLQSLGGEDDGK